MGLRATNRHARVYHDLAVMIEAGLPLIRALNSVRQGTSHRMAGALRRIHQALHKGSSLAEAMGAERGFFAEFDCNIIAAAETSGRLDECLHMLADWYDFQDRMSRRCLSGLILPFLTIHVAALVFPLPRLVLGQIETWAYGWAVLGWLSIFYVPTFIIFFVWRLAPQQGLLRRFLDYGLLRVPLLGLGLRELGISRHSRTFNMLYKSGVPIIQGLEQATQATGNLAVAGMVKRCPECARTGEPASNGLTRRIPHEYRELWKIGEESGELERTVDKIAEISADRADLYLSQFSAWTPKLVYGMVALAMVYMIYQLATGYRDTILEFMQ